MEEEYVFVNSTLGLWRLRFEGKELKGPVERGVDKGVMTELCSYEDKDVPWGAGVIKWKSKLFFVGGEKPLPNDNPGEEGRVYNSEHFTNRRVYDCEDPHKDWKLKKPPRKLFIYVAPTTPPCAYPKACPYVFPVKSGPKTLFFVVGVRPLLCRYIRGAAVEIFDPESESWETPPQPDAKSLAGSYSAFEFCGMVFIIGQGEASFCPGSNTWRRTAYFDLPLLNAPIATVAVEGLSDTIRIGISNYDGNVYAYKLNENENENEPRVVMQELPEVDQYCNYPDIFPEDVPIQYSLSSLGNGRVLFMHSSYYRGLPDDDFLVHYFCLKIHFTQEEASADVKARVLDCCIKTVPMSDDDLQKVAFHFGMNSAFVL